MTILNFEEIHKHLVETTGKDDKLISSFIYTIQSKGFKDGTFVTLVKDWKSLSETEQIEKAKEYAGVYFSSTFFVMMSYLTKVKEKESTTEIVFILDKSGSMGSIRSDAIGGFNSFLQDQKKVEGKTKMTLHLFEGNITTVVDGKDINEVEELTEKTFVPWGGTALIDAIGTAIDSFNKRISEQVEQPDNVIFVIMTDGDENMSRNYSSEQVKNKIVNMTNREYQFIFLGANIDSVSTAKKFGINANFAGDFVAKGNGTSMAMLHANEMITSYRSMGKMASYNEVILKDTIGDLGALTKKTSLDISDALQKVAERAKEED